MLNVWTLSEGSTVSILDTYQDFYVQGPLWVDVIHLACQKIMFVCNLNVEYHIHKSPRCRCELSVHAMKAYRGSRGIFPLIFNLDTGWRSAVNFTAGHFKPCQTPLIPIEQQAGLYILEERKISCSYQKRTPDHPACSLVITMTMLFHPPSRSSWILSITSCSYCLRVICLRFDKQKFVCICDLHVNIVCLTNHGLSRYSDSLRAGWPGI